MLWPTICLDNFFDETNKILKFANSLEYNSSSSGKWPGKRTAPLHQIDKFFFELFAKKVLSVLYPINFEEISYNLELYFQKISQEYINEGWIHDDHHAEFTSIVYLSDHKECGTSFFDTKTVCASYKNIDSKIESYKNKNFIKEQNKLKENNIQFEETITIKSKFNRLIIFDGGQLHGAKNFIDGNIKEDRLTLVGFFHNINLSNIKYNGIQHKRIKCI